MSLPIEYQSWHRLAASALIFSLTLLQGCGDDSQPAAVLEEEQVEDEIHDVVVLDSTAVGIANITLVPVETVQTIGLPVTGIITYDANRVSHIGPRIDGRIVRLAADIGEQVAGGQVLAILESPEVGQIRADESEAVALVGIARENYQRELRLEEQGISSRKELLDAEAELRRMEASLNSARQRLQVLGAGQGEGGQFALMAPFPGVVVARHASLGEMASPADQLFTVANLDRLWIELDIYERDLSRVTRGQAVDVATAAYPGRTFPGQIVYVGDIVDPEKRAVPARVEIPNRDNVLKPGMFANALIRVGSAGPPVAVVPQEAVQQVEGRSVVFVPGTRPGEFRVQPVEVGDAIDEGRVLVISGLQAGDRVVTTGAFALRSELAEGEIGEAGHGH
ncbi:MAG: efflux RND transporter periplasmic adaptor subunit [Gemmatimonas sp.]|nr:efflux RND transporter periplasmic adaptor subunit [Gemmatimonas sp.]